MEIPGAYAAQIRASLKKAQQAIDVLHLESARKKYIFSTPLETKIWTGCFKGVYLARRNPVLFFYLIQISLQGIIFSSFKKS